MKKNNNKGFVLLETLVVSSFIITILIYLYVQFVSLKNSYDTSFRYDSIPNLYSLKQVDTFINKAYGYETFKSELAKSENNNYLELYKNKCDLEYFSNNNSYCNKLMENLNIKTLLIINNNLASIKTRFKEHNPYSNGLYKYLKTIDPVLASKSYLLIAEFNDKSYAYLRVDDVNVVVTFDANGGSVKTRTKNVTPGNTYGELPTPTREGYTFKGWNGKNIFSDSDIVSSSKWTPNQNVSVTKENGFVQVLYNQNNSTPGYIYRFDNGDIKLNKPYTASISAKGIGTNKLRLGVYGNIVASWNDLSNSKFNRFDTTFTITSKSQNYILFYENLNESSTEHIGTGFQIKDFMIEEGEEATEYEPYYVTKDTKVVQSSNHTLKAIWEVNN